MHVIYIEEEQFWRDYEFNLKITDCSSDDKQKIIEEIEREVKRRSQLDFESQKRIAQIQDSYSPLHPDVYVLQKHFMDPFFLRLVELAKLSSKFEDLLSLLDTSFKDKGLYSFPVFTETFCNKFIEELKNFEETRIERGRPNTMNMYGILLGELGFDKNFFDPLRTDYLQPIAQLIFPKWCGENLDSHRAFTVSYKIGEDTELNYHYDNSEVTLNVCLGQIFSDGDLYFGDMKNTDPNESTCTVFPHRIGYGVLHRGQQLHGALPISRGERHNMIIWMRSSSIRNQLCPMCNQCPTLMPAFHYGDGFTK